MSYDQIFSITRITLKKGESNKKKKVVYWKLSYTKNTQVSTDDKKKRLCIGNRWFSSNILAKYVNINIFKNKEINPQYIFCHIYPHFYLQHL